MKPILEISNIGKRYRITHQAGGYLSLRERMMDVFREEKRTTEDFWALKDISFDVSAGDSVGIIGRNGAGKSTLLKILSRITPPTTGKFTTRGRIASLLEVGTGFHPELTGRENVFLNGSLLGMKKKEIEIKFDEIIDFSGVEKFLDTPLKHYSSGMQLRLAFAVAAVLEPEILIIDEVLAVGDTEFQKKCMGKMKDVSESGRTILFVSHQMGMVAQLCRKAILLTNGQITLAGDARQVTSSYQASAKALKDLQFQKIQGSICFSDIKMMNAEGEASNNFTNEEAIVILFNLSLGSKRNNDSLFVTILNEDKSPVSSTEIFVNSPSHTLTINKNFLTEGDYSIQAILHNRSSEQYQNYFDILHFSVTDKNSDFVIYNVNKYQYGNVFGSFSWK